MFQYYLYLDLFIPIYFLSLIVIVTFLLKELCLKCDLLKIFRPPTFEILHTMRNQQALHDIISMSGVRAITKYFGYRREGSASIFSSQSISMTQAKEQVK